MSDWKFAGQIELENLGALAPVEILYEFDGPCIFTAKIPTGLVLLYLAEELEDETLRFIASPCAQKTIAGLLEGALSVRDALELGSMFVVEMNQRREPKAAFQLADGGALDSVLPEPSTMLLPELEPEFVVRLEGESIVRGSVPTAVLAQAADIGSSLLKSVCEYVADRRSPGRPPEWLKGIYAMPTQRIAYGSLEVAFSLPQMTHHQLPLDLPDEVSPEELQAEGLALIEEGLHWASSDEQSLPDEDKAKWRAILEALKKISPPTQGAVQGVRLWGKAVGRVYSLDAPVAKKVRRALRESKKGHEDHLRLFTGKVRDLDLDKMTMILRDVEGVEGDVNLVLDNDVFLEIVREAHYQEIPVSVAARSTDLKVWRVSDVEFVGPLENSGV